MQNAEVILLIFLLVGVILLNEAWIELLFLLGLDY